MKPVGNARDIIRAGQRDAAQRFSLKPVRFQGVNTLQMLADFHALPG